MANRGDTLPIVLDYTINGTYTARVYGVKLIDLIGG